jgi:hypothetical protein
MRLLDDHDERANADGLPGLVKRLEAVNAAIEEYRAAALDLEQARVSFFERRASGTTVSP